MHRKLALALAVLCVLGVASRAGAKDYWFPRVEIDVTVNADGSFHFRESRTYEFEDKYTFAYYQVEKRRLSGGAPVDITDFVISENGTPFDLRSKGEIEEPRTPGTYWVSYDYEGDSAYGKWFYRAEDETRTFDITYTVHDAVTVHDDFAQLYWKFIAESWEKPVGVVTGFIHLPPGADQDNVRGWLHAPLTSEYWIRDARTIEFRVDTLPPGQFVEMRILFPTSLVPDADVREAGAVWDRAFGEEKQWVEEANAERVRAQERVKSYYAAQKKGNIAAAAVAVLVLLVWFGVFWRFGREHTVPFEGDYYRELPSERPPAIVGYLYRSGSVTTDDMVATIMDLARRGHIKITETEREKPTFLGIGGGTEYDYVLERLERNRGDLQEFEKDLLAFLFGSPAARLHLLSLNEFKKDAQKHSSQYLSWFRGWMKDAQRAAEKEGFFEKASSRMMVVSILVGVGGAAAGMLIMALTHSYLGAATFIVGFVVTLLSLLVRRRSPAGALEFAKWKALRRYLLHFSQLKDAPPQSLVLWEHFLVYGVTLGVSKEVLKQLEPHLPAMEQAAGRSFAAGWYVGASSRFGDGLGGSIAGLSEGLSSMVAVAGSAMSTASGTGGGGSGGGGSGGGGGGGGGAG